MSPSSFPGFEEAVGQRVVIAMSGGVDSSVAASLLLERGYEPIGLFLRSGVEAPEKAGRSETCCSVYDARDARMVARDLGIPFHAIDLSAEFEGLIGYFASEYASGRTPNPCAVCNRELKFGRLYEIARELGADLLATGHYARLERSDGCVALHRAADRRKDQSYQLFDVPAEILDRVLFPLGELCKDEVREIARRKGLRVSEKPDSQEICFVPSGDYRDLLRERGVESAAGEVVDRSGRVLARHAGVAHFTVGQRRGIGIAAGEPRYVVELDAAAGRVVVGPREECLFRGARVRRLNWLVEPPAKGEERRLDAQIRYRHPGRPGVLRRTGPDEVEFLFERPELAVTPGQAAVFYEGDRVLGGGWIEAAI